MTDHHDPNDGTRYWTPPRDGLGPASADAPLPSTANPVEPGTAWAGPAAPATRRRSRLRWAVAGLVVVLLVTATAAAAVLLTGRAPASPGVGYLPATSVMYGELRLDLPGDQRAKLAGFLSHFPGFADQAALQPKLDETLDRLLTGATDGKVGYSRDIAPWFGGQIAVGVSALPSVTPSAARPETPHGLAVATVTDATRAAAWLQSVTTGVDGITSTSYGGTQLYTLSNTGAGRDAAYAVADGKALLVGDVESVKAAIDSHGTGRLGQDGAASAAAEALDGDHVGYLFIDTKAWVAWQQDAMQALGGAQGASLPPIPDMAGLIGDWMSFQLRFENDALELDSAADVAERLPPVGADRRSDIADLVPASSVVYGEGHDVGQVVKQLLDVYRGEPAMAAQLKGVEDAAKLVGGLDGASGWIGDSAVAVTADGTTVEGGLVLVPTDADAASRFVTSIDGLVALGGSQLGIASRQEPYAGTTITTLDLSGLHTLGGTVGGGSDPSGAITPPIPVGGASLELSYAVGPKAVVVGVGESFVKHALDVQAGGPSLGAQSRYRDLLARVGDTNRSVAFVDVRAIRAIVERMAGSNAAYERDVRPFVVPIDALISATHSDGKTITSRVLLTTK